MTFTRYLTVIFLGLLLLPASGFAQQLESYYLYIGEHPTDANPGWHEDVQGITHDDDNWYITHAVTDDSSRQAMWKIPVGVNLASSVSPGSNGVERISISDIWAADQEFANKGYWHFGDISYYQYDNQGYIFVPFESWDNPYLCFAVFTTNPFQYLDHAPIDLQRQTHAAWVAIDPRPTDEGGGVLYSATENFSVINKFGVVWNTLKTQGELVLTDLGGVTIKDESNNTMLIESVRGGVFSESAQQLYIIAGSYKKHVTNEGINVFDTQTWKRLAASTNGSGHFNYQFKPINYPGEMEEPEGLTIWNLDSNRAPGISGQLHAFMLDNDAGPDDIYFKHYTGTIYVDGVSSGNGTPTNPFRTVTQANNLVNSANWNGAQIGIKAGTYAEAVTFSKFLRIFPIDGTVNIGTINPVALFPPATFGDVE